MLQAIENMHSAGIIHRDIKPVSKELFFTILVELCDGQNFVGRLEFSVLG